jgi:hypothetical protein
MIHDPAHGCCRIMARIEQQKNGGFPKYSGKGMA